MISVFHNVIRRQKYEVAGFLNYFVLQNQMNSCQDDGLKYTSIEKKKNTQLCVIKNNTIH